MDVGRLHTEELHIPVTFERFLTKLLHLHAYKIEVINFRQQVMHSEDSWSLPIGSMNNK